MHEGPPQNENSEDKIEKEKTPLSPEEKAEWLDGMEEFRQELEKEIERLKEEIDDMEDNKERQEKEVLVYELEEQVEGMKDFVEVGRNPEEDLYRAEEAPDDIEEGQESIPTPKEVQSVFEQLVGEEEYEDIRKLEDEDGLYLRDIKIPGEDGDTEYSYRRGRPLEEELSGFRIDITFFDEEGIPVGGHSVAKYVEGEWKLTP